MTRRTLFGGLAAFLPWRWFGRERPTFQLTIEPVGTALLTTYYNGEWDNYTFACRINNVAARIVSYRTRGKIPRKRLSIHFEVDPLPALTHWMETNPDVWVSRYTEPSKEAEKP